MITADSVKAQIQGLRVQGGELFADEEAWLLSLESETDMNELCVKVVRMILENDANIIGLTEIIKDLKKRLEMFDRRDIAFRAILLSIMDVAGLKTMRLPIATLSMTHPEKVQVIEPGLIPEYYRRQPPWEANKLLIKAALKGGHDVPGCALSNAEPSLTVRVK